MSGRAPVSTRLLALAVLVVAAVSAAGCSRKTLEPGVLKVCLYPGFAPFVSKDEKGEWVGDDVVYLKAFSDQEKLTFEPVEIAEFKDIWTLPGEGKCDIAATGISDLAERRKQTGTDGVWSDHYYRVVRSFAVRTGSVLNGVEDLRDKRVIVTGDSTADLDLRNRLKGAGIDSVTIDTTTDEEAAAVLVRDGVGEGAPFAYGGGLGSVQLLVEKRGGLEVAWQHCNMLADGKEVDEPFSFVVRAKSADLTEALNRYIATATYGLPEPALKCPPSS
jgi:ABC-type amino acid transport substrate-binding protein